MDKTVFLKCSSHAKISTDKAVVRDAAEVYCADKALSNKVKTIKIAHLKKPGSRKVVSVLYIMEKISEEIPGITLETIGETDTIVEWEKEQHLESIKIVLVCLIAFFGTAFTIMAFHNDIGIRNVFEEIYHITRGTVPEGVGILELSYCVGLFLGITVFFNHFGKKKFTDDPTPITVAMRNYEKDVNQTIIETAERKGDEASE